PPPPPPPPPPPRGKPLVLFSEHAGLGMPEEQASQHLLADALDGNGQVAPDRQSAGRDALIRSVLSIPGVSGHVVETHRPLAVKRRGKHGRRTRVGESCEGLSRRP